MSVEQRAIKIRCLASLLRKKIFFASKEPKQVVAQRYSSHALEILIQFFYNSNSSAVSPRFTEALNQLVIKSTDRNKLVGLMTAMSYTEEKMDINRKENLKISSKQRIQSL